MRRHKCVLVNTRECDHCAYADQQEKVKHRSTLALSCYLRYSHGDEMSKRVMDWPHRAPTQRNSSQKAGGYSKVNNGQENELKKQFKMKKVLMGEKVFSEVCGWCLPTSNRE
ncbi:hypothetical protein TRVL_07682 [Trypanosoma vivax]|nr:hypothetical protein TRVL_07682 [Trypanosoma vivax]